MRFTCHVLAVKYLSPQMAKHPLTASGKPSVLLLAVTGSVPCLTEH